jgi:hypothetical protein
VTQVTLMQKQIIQKLYIHSYIGAKHTSQENIPKNFPKHLRGQAKTELQQLIKQDIINQHPTSYEPQISLNPKKLEDIKKILEL